MDEGHVKRETRKKKQSYDKVFRSLVSLKIEILWRIWVSWECLGVSVRERVEKKAFSYLQKSIGESFCWMILSHHRFQFFFRHLKNWEIFCWIFYANASQEL